MPRKYTRVRMSGNWFASSSIVIDDYTNMIVGWECSAYKETRLVESAFQ